ncbi:MAG: biotin--[acetyl-CoA-carboxylase] ligase, partial [Chitinophagaceae bacterium]|nr:biotin--[acetyl-CoA-carboxylase] ligase [Chitinophagaceae bacterium]
NLHIQLDEVDSTNNYAMRLIDDDKAQNGQIVSARHQLNGKGQRSRIWTATKDKSLSMSIIVEPNLPLSKMIVFNKAIAVAVVKAIHSFYPALRCTIKWPNDIICDDKKAGGVLIENVIRGQQWAYSVIGIGINIFQEGPMADLPHAGSLFHEGSKPNDINDLMIELYATILKQITTFKEAEINMLYHTLLYKKAQLQLFKSDAIVWEALIEGVNEKGDLIVSKSDGSVLQLKHGEADWVWDTQ